MSFYFLFWAWWAAFWLGVISTHHEWQAIGWWFHRRAMRRLARHEEYLAFMGFKYDTGPDRGLTYQAWADRRGAQPEIR